MDAVAVLGTLPPIRGLSSYCREFAIALAKTRTVHFISFKHLYPAALYPGGNLREDRSFPPMPSGNLIVKRRLSWFNPLTWLMEGLLTPGDILHAQWWSLPLAPVYWVVCLGFRLRRKPVVFTVHNVVSHEPSILYRWATACLFCLGRSFIVHTRLNKQQLTDIYGISPDRIHVIPHGPLGFRTIENPDHEGIRNRLGILSSENLLLVFGAIRPYKGIDTALKAFAQVLKTIPECRLLIAGKLWESWEPYDRLIRDLGILDRVILHPDYIPASDVAGYFVAADMVLLPYHHFDSQSGVGATALGFGKPMIVSDAGGLAEFVADPRCVAPSGNPSALASAIVDCLLDRTRLESMARDSAAIAGDMSWSGIIRKTCDVYRENGKNRRQNSEVSRKSVKSFSYDGVKLSE
ncbi:MAG: glycosyltransferase [Desulfatirhabdiaceae bacterium]